MYPPVDSDPPPYSEQPPFQLPTAVDSFNQTNQPAPPPYSAHPVHMASQPQPPVQIVFQNLVQLGPNPMQVLCPECHVLVTTKTVYESGSLTWLSCCLTFMVGAWACCCLLPFCCSACQDVKHVCPQCNTTLGHYKRL